MDRIQTVPVGISLQVRTLACFQNGRADSVALGSVVVRWASFANYCPGLPLAFGMGRLIWRSGGVWVRGLNMARPFVQAVVTFGCGRPKRADAASGLAIPTSNLGKTLVPAGRFYLRNSSVVTTWL